MFRFLFICLLLVPIATIAQRLHDTTFINETAFIVSNREATIYKTMANVVINSDDTALYRYNILEVKSSLKHPLSKHNLYGLPQTWRLMVCYNDAYYPLRHEDIGSEQLLLSDSVIIHFYMDGGPTPSPLNAVNKKGKNTYELITENYDHTYDTTRIWIVDSAKGIAVIYDAIYRQYHLMVDTRQIRNFPLIICYSPTQRVRSYKGQPIDYPTLIKKSRE